MIEFDWSEAYPLMGGVLFVVCGVLLIFFEAWRYGKIGHGYEQRNSRLWGWVQLVIGCGLILAYELYWYVL
ncbi:CLC_0170 family protein [Alicyclobacillus shizuokensis]|uniref:CLC_0170 family protein n=1 Tax=Alicyclobacillus shizuokensis TaxID=392014 RepID=UPI00082E4E99|nr:CLC_0170 family protein [Alicyclobacillus shizuokensis]MCL6627238.1 hypothetical protein [Alicyclobacillus shizuokensis]